MFDDDVYILDIDKNKGLCTNSGDVLFFNNAIEFKKYLSDNLGQDFSDCIISESYNIDAQDLYDKLCTACEEIEDLDYHYNTKSPVLELKKHRENFKLLQECRDVLKDILNIY